MARVTFPFAIAFGIPRHLSHSREKKKKGSSTCTQELGLPGASSAGPCRAKQVMNKPLGSCKWLDSLRIHSHCRSRWQGWVFLEGLTESHLHENFLQF